MTNRRILGNLLGCIALACASGCAGTDLASLFSDLGLAVDVNIDTTADGSAGSALDDSRSDGSGNSNDSGSLDNDNASFDDDSTTSGGDDSGSGNNDSDGSDDDGDNDDDDGDDDNGGVGSGSDDPSGLVGDAMIGESVFSANNCNACHGADGSGPPSIVGRNASSLGEHARKGQEHPGGAFPALTDQDLADLAAFLEP